MNFIHQTYNHANGPLTVPAPTFVKTAIEPRYKNFVKFNTSWNFRKQHDVKCEGHFEIMPHWDQNTATKKVCTVCGAIEQFVYRKFDIREPREHRPTIRKGFIDQEVIFTGYIPKKVMGYKSDNLDPDTRHIYEYTCLECGAGFDSSNKQDFCSSCRHTEPESKLFNFDDFYHDTVETWQQGAIWEVGHTEHHEQSDYGIAIKHMARAQELTQEATQLLKMSRYIAETHDQHTPYDSFMARMNAHAARAKAKREQVHAKTFFKSHRETMKLAVKVRLAKLYQAQNEEEAAARQRYYMRTCGFYDMVGRLTMNYHTKQAREDVLTSARHTKAYNVYRARTTPLVKGNKSNQTNTPQPYVLMVTGHRPQKLPRPNEIKLKMLEFVERKQEKHPEIMLISGMAQGIDTMFTEIGLKLGIPVIAFVPFKTQAKPWQQHAREHYNALLKQATAVITVCKEYSNAAYFKRNDAMVHASTACLAVWDGSTGGTYHAVNAAKKKGIELTIIDPTTKQATFI